MSLEDDLQALDKENQDKAKAIPEAEVVKPVAKKESKFKNIAGNLMAAVGGMSLMTAGVGAALSIISITMMYSGMSLLLTIATLAGIGILLSYLAQFMITEPWGMEGYSF